MIRYLPISSFFFFNDTATTEIYTLSLHDALPIFIDGDGFAAARTGKNNRDWAGHSVADGHVVLGNVLVGPHVLDAMEDRKSTRLNSSHQIISYAVFCLKKKKNRTQRA